jgi:hypothetical protein
MAGRTDAPWWQHTRARTAHHWIWSTIVGALVAAGGLAFVEQLGWAAALVGLVLGTVTIASCVLAVRSEGAASYVRAVRTGALVTGVVLATSGLVRLVGPVAYVAPALVVGMWPGLPPLLARARRMLRGRGDEVDPGHPRRPSIEVATASGSIDMSAFEAAMLDGDPAESVPDDHDSRSPMGLVPTDELCRLWRRTFVLLAQDIPPETTMQLVLVREGCLDELRVRAPGAYRQMVESGETPVNDLRRFFEDSGDLGDTGDSRRR